MNNMAYNEAGAWSETCLIGITEKGGSEIQFASLIETVDVDMGDKDVEVIANLKGGRVIKKVPQGEITITFEGYPILTNSTTPKGFSELFHSPETWDTTEPLQVSGSLRRDLYRVSILWSTGSETTASAASTASSTALRFVAANCYCTQWKPSFTDGILKATLAFKLAPFNRIGVSQWIEQSTDGTTVLAQLGDYGVTNFPVDGTAFTWDTT